MNLIFNLLAPADKILQQRSSSLVAGYDVINSTIQWRAEGGEANGAPAPGIQGRGGIQRVKLQKYKCRN